MEKEVYRKMYEREDVFWWHQGMKKITAVFLDSYLKNSKGNNILDVGCGTGGIHKTLAEYGNVSGVDASPEAIFYARKRNISSVVGAEADALPFDHSSFDLLTCFDVIHHRLIKDDSSVLREFNRVLKKGGTLLIREPAFDWLRGDHDKVVWTGHRYSRKELREKIEEAGFTVLKDSYANFFLFPVVLLTRLPRLAFSRQKTLDEMFSVHPFINFILEKFLYAEAKLLKHINLPFGSSIVCIARKSR